MITEIVYTETYKSTLSIVVKGIEEDWGLNKVQLFLNRVDAIVSKIIQSPHLYQEIPIGSNLRKAVISRQSSLVYEVKGSKIILMYIFDNRQDPFWS